MKINVGNTDCGYKNKMQKVCVIYYLWEMVNEKLLINISYKNLLSSFWLHFYFNLKYFTTKWPKVNTNVHEMNENLEKQNTKTKTTTKYKNKPKIQKLCCYN